MKPVRARLTRVAAAALLGCGAWAPWPAAAQTGLEQVAASLPGRGGCRELTGQGLQELTLMSAVEHVLCKSPLLNQALLLVDEQQAGVDLARAAYRPRVSAFAEVASNRIPSSNSGSGSLSSSLTGSLGVSWVLYDAGVRNANLEQSRQLLASARSAQHVSSINAVNEALRLYVEAATAWARLEALRDTETVARQSLEAAEAKHAAQVASLSEKLQAQTALAQATLDRVRAEGVWETARGLLAVAMGFAVDTPLSLAPISAAFPAISARGALDNWIADARRDHPRVRVARADVLALKARVDAVRAEGKGNVQLSLGAGSTRDLGTPGGRFEHSLSGYVVASIPLFNHTEQQARETQALAQVASREAALTQVERDVESDLWRNARLLETEAQNLNAAKMLLRAASQSYQITFGRYKAGVGSILELISTQVALSNARSQLTQAQLGHAQARLRLEVASGRVVLNK